MIFSKLNLSIWICLLFIFNPGFGQQSFPQTRKDLMAFLDNLGDRYEKISIEMGIANWNVYSGDGDADQNLPKQKYAELLLDPVSLKIIDEWLGKISSQKSPRLYRRLRVWRDVMTAARVDMDKDVFQLENQLEADISGYCHLVRGKRVKHRKLKSTLETIFKNQETVEKKYSELMTVMQKRLEPLVIRLMKMRNKKSREAGFDDYGHLCLKMMGLLPDNSSWFYDFLTLMETKTRLPYKRLLNAGKLKNTTEIVNLDVLEEVISSNTIDIPEHTGYSKDKAKDLAEKTLFNIGIDPDKLPIRIVEKIIPYGGLGLAIQVPSDHRILVFPGRNSVGLYLHELGHGLHAVFTSWTEPIFKNYEWCLGASTPAYNEGMANVISGFYKNSCWQKKYNQKSQQRIDQERTNSLILAPYTIRKSISGFMFELKMYQDLTKSPQQVKKQLIKKWLFFNPSKPVSPYWATSIYPVAYPCYLQSYFISRIVTWQVHDFLEKRFGQNYIFNQNVGTWLKENLFYMGHGLSWLDRIKRATGRPLDVVGYLSSLDIR